MTLTSFLKHDTKKTMTTREQTRKGMTERTVVNITQASHIVTKRAKNPTDCDTRLQVKKRTLEKMSVCLFACLSLLHAWCVTHFACRVCFLWVNLKRVQGYSMSVLHLEWTLATSSNLLSIGWWKPCLLMKNRDKNRKKGGVRQFASTQICISRLRLCWVKRVKKLMMEDLLQKKSNKAFTT